LGILEFLRDLFSEEKRKEFFVNYIWDHDPFFRYPIRVLGSVMMTIIIFYDFCIFWGILLIPYADEIACFTAVALSNPEISIARNLRFDLFSSSSSSSSFSFFNQFSFFLFPFLLGLLSNET